MINTKNIILSILIVQLLISAIWNIFPVEYKYLFLNQLPVVTLEDSCIKFYKKNNEYNDYVYITGKGVMANYFDGVADAYGVMKGNHQYLILNAYEKEISNRRVFSVACILEQEKINEASTNQLIDLQLYEKYKAYGKMNLAFDYLSQALNKAEKETKFQFATDMAENKVSPEKIYKSYLELAESGYPPAQYKTGLSLLHGNGVKKNIDTSVAWLKRAADNGSSESRFLLGDIYLSEKSMRNVDEAINWYSKSDTAEAFYRIGLIYLSDEKKNRNFAEFWLNKAVYAGYKQARYYLNNIHMEVINKELLELKKQEDDERIRMEAENLKLTELKKTEEEKNIKIKIASERMVRSRPNCGDVRMSMRAFISCKE